MMRVPPWRAVCLSSPAAGLLDWYGNISVGNDEKYVIAFKDSMRVGEEYVLLLQKPDETAVSFVVDSLYSILPVNSEDAAIVHLFK